MSVFGSGIKVRDDTILGAWNSENEKAAGIMIGARKPQEMSYEGIVMLMTDSNGETHLIINQDKLEAINGKIHIKQYGDPYEPCGISAK